MNNPGSPVEDMAVKNIDDHIQREILKHSAYWNAIIVKKIAEIESNAAMIAEKSKEKDAVGTKRKLDGAVTETRTVCMFTD